jgi:hypothetical protein
MVMANQEGWTLVLNEILLNFSDFGFTDEEDAKCILAIPTGGEYEDTRA